MRSHHGILGRIYAKLPQAIREKTGEQTYEAYINIRRRILGATPKIAEGKRKITYIETNRGHKETLIFLHGFADSKDNFYDAGHYLAQHFNLICPDLPGFGKSSKLRGDRYNLENYAEWIADFANTIGLDSFHLAGNSLGGAVAAQLAIDHGHLVKSLTLVDPAGVFYEDQYSLHHELFSGRVIFDIQNRQHFEYFLHRVYYRNILLPAPVKDHFFKEFKRHSRWHRKILGDLFEGLKSIDDPNLYKTALNNRLQHIKADTLILWGDEDTLFPYQTAYLMKEHMPHAKLHFFTDVGHCPQVESPRMFSRVLRKFVSELEPKLFDQQALKILKSEKAPGKSSANLKKKTTRVASKTATKAKKSPSKVKKAKPEKIQSKQVASVANAVKGQAKL